MFERVDLKNNSKKKSHENKNDEMDNNGSRESKDHNQVKKSSL